MINCGVDYARSLSSLSAILDLTGRDKKVLDIGCARGQVARQLLLRDCTTTGVELDADAAEHARDACERVLVGSVDDPAVRITLSTSGPFDVVVLGDVLEHLVNPADTLRYVRSVLSPNGSVVASVPNVAFVGMRVRLLFGRFDYTPTGLLDRSHLRFFTLRSLGQMFVACGFSLDTVRGQAVELGGRRLHNWMGSDILTRASNRILAALARVHPELFAYQLVIRARCVR